MDETRESCFQSIADLATGLATRRISAVELADAYLNRIARLDGELRSYVTVTAERARAEARAVDQAIARGEYRGPLHGIPIGLKDLYDTAGSRTTASSALLAERVPQKDATCARRLAEAGTILLGKLNMHEFAFGGPNRSGKFGAARNPWNLERIPGGSSSGSGAALAAGLCAGALGSDTGGSIRGPASLCGIVGLKPTYGLCSRYGVLPLSWTLDHTGPMARTVEDCAILLQALAGYDSRDPASASVQIPDYRSCLTGELRGLRIGAPLSYLEALPDLAEETLTSYRASLMDLERLGAVVDAVDLPCDQHLDIVGHVILVAEAYSYHEENFKLRPHLYGDQFRSAAQVGALVSSADYITAQRGRAMITREFLALMERFDLLALPTSVSTAKTFDQEEAVRSGTRTNLTRPFNITGQPAISVPCGFSADGMPIGLQLAGRPFDEATVLRAAHAYEQATTWHTRRCS